MLLLKTCLQTWINWQMWYLITRFRCSHVWARERCVSSASAALSFDSACETWTTAVTALGLVLKLDSWHFYNLYLLKPALYLQLVKAPPLFFFSQSQLTFGTNICQLCSGISALVSSTTSLPLFFFAKDAHRAENTWRQCSSVRRELFVCIPMQNIGSLVCVYFW